MTEQVVPYAAAIGQGFILMDDNAPAHRARVVTRYLEEEGIERMEWPARSPDLNPIENLWDLIGQAATRHLRGNTTLQQFARILQRVWDNLEQQVIRNLINSMRRRCAAVIESNGGPIPY